MQVNRLYWNKISNDWIVGETNGLIRINEFITFPVSSSMDFGLNIPLYNVPPMQLIDKLRVMSMDKEDERVFSTSGKEINDGNYIS